MSPEMFKCQLCGGAEQTRFATIKDKSSRQSGKSWDYVKCAGCGTLSIYPLPSEEELMNASNSLMGLKREGSSFDLHFSPEYRETYNRELTKTFSELGLGPPGTLLDIGCANGQFLDYMSNRGWQTFGCDISKQLTDQADKVRHKIYCEDVFTLDLPQFDMVSMIDTLEHVNDPRAFIIRCAELLKPKGILFLQTPVQGVLSDGYGEHWRRLTPPDHVHLLRAEYLLELLSDHGFTVTSTSRWGSGCSMGAAPDHFKRCWDYVAKELQIGDEMSLIANLRGEA